MFDRFPTIQSIQSSSSTLYSSSKYSLFVTSKRRFFDNFSIERRVAIWPNCRERNSGATVPAATRIGGEKLNVPYRRHATLLKLLATVVRGPAVPAVTMKLCTQWGGTTRGGTTCRAEGLERKEGE